MQLCDYGEQSGMAVRTSHAHLLQNEIFIMTNLCTSVWTSVPIHRPVLFTAG